MADIPGLPRIRKQCKICNVFSHTDLEEITKDLILGECTYQQAIEKYTPRVLPEYENRLPLNPQNCSSHKKHCDPRHLAEAALRGTGMLATEVGESELLRYVFGEMKNEFDRNDALIQIHKERIRSMTVIQTILNEKQAQYQLSPDRKEKERLIKEITDLTSQSEKLWSTLSKELIVTLNNDNVSAVSAHTISIPQLFSIMRGIIDDISHRLYFQYHDDKVHKRTIVSEIGKAMDDALDKMFEELGVSTEEQGRYRTECIPHESRTNAPEITEEE